MRDISPLRERYLRDSLPVRLGGLAASLRRIRSFAAHEEGGEAVAGLIEECKYFIEWTAADAPVDTAAQLVDLQVQLARWQHNWAGIWSDPIRRQRLAEHSLAWSERLLRLSGLLPSQNPQGSQPQTT
ncbi:MAG: hypothetical protein NTY23_15320 [Chloroflexi bacterium]|nr:hypothetical protein [Chloroflexota bacterium]